MSEPKDFTASLDTDSRRTPVRVAFVTRRTSPQVQARDETHVMTWPEVLLRAAVAVEALLSDWCCYRFSGMRRSKGWRIRMQTPNPAKAPWYFLGLQELLHYFPPVVAGVLIPTMVVLALIVIPYFGINIESEGFWITNRGKKIRALAHRRHRADGVSFVVRSLRGTRSDTVDRGSDVCGGISRKWLALCQATAFLDHDVVSDGAIILTVIGTFFRGAGWAWVWPWGGHEPALDSAVGSFRRQRPRIWLAERNSAAPAGDRAGEGSFS